MEIILLSLKRTSRTWLWAGLALAGVDTAPSFVQAASFNTGAHPAPLAVTLTGYVFEDANYGGGAGRPLGTGGISTRGGATVELYDAAGNFVATTTTDFTGQYSFSASENTTYQVRVVNASVTSGRTGYTAALRSVQTYAGLTGDASATSRVGGAAPQLVDAAANTAQGNLSTLTTSTTTAESVATVTTGIAATAGPNFGFCFDVVVNTNDAGQGSLRQFVLNANALGGEGSLAQSGFTRSTTSATNAALPAGREASIFMIPDGLIHPGLRAATDGGPANALTLQNSQRVAVITMTVASGGFQITGANAALTTIDGGTQTANVGDTNTAVLGTGGSVGTGASLSYTSFSGPEVQLLGEYAAANAAGSRKPRNCVNVAADDFTFRNLAARNFGNPGGQGTIGFDLVPGRTGPLAGYSGGTGQQGSVRSVLENNVFGTDATTFTAPSPFTSAEGDNGRSNQHIQYDVSGTSLTVKTLTVQTNLIGFSERRALHIQGNAGIESGYNLNLTIFNNVFQAAGVNGSNADFPSAPYASSSAGSVELIMTTTPFFEVYNNRITGSGAAGAGSDGIEINNATITVLNPDGTQTVNNIRRDAGTAQAGTRVEQNTITTQRLGILCQSNVAFASFALDGVLFRGNSITGNYIGGSNQGANQQFQNNVVTGSTLLGFANIGPGVTFSGNTFSRNGTDGLLVGDGTQAAATDTKPATTGVVVGPGNVFTGNGRTGTLLTNTSTRTTLTQNSHYANGSLGIDLSVSTDAAGAVGDGVTPNNGTLRDDFPDRELDYPILTSAALQGTQLTISGYVGSAPGQTTFGGARVEFFTADNTPANQNGPLVAGDGQSVPHGEGRSYLGTLTANADGTFSGTFAVSGLAGGDFVTGTATLGNGAQASTSEFGNNVVVVLTPLPVQLVAFTARAVEGRDTRLAWTTASELRNAYFAIERSLDGVTFARIGQVAGQGSKASATDYAYTDANAGPRVPAGQLLYYRLRQVDTDGTATYSPVRSLAFDGAAAALGFSLYPNPAPAGTTLDLSALPATRSYQVRLLDATGRQVSQALLPGGQATALDVSSLARGTYQVFITGQQADGSALRQVLRLTRE